MRSPADSLRSNPSPATTQKRPEASASGRFLYLAAARIISAAFDPASGQGRTRPFFLTRRARYRAIGSVIGNAIHMSAAPDQ